MMKMFKLLFGGIPADFESDCAVDETIQKVTNLIRDNNRMPSAEPKLSGKITKRKATLSAGNACSIKDCYAPFFYGTFEPHGGQTRLVGHFCIERSGQLFLACWLGIITFMLFMAAREEDKTILMLVIAVLCFVGIALAFMLNAQLKKIPDLSNMIRTALSAATKHEKRHSD